MRLYPLLMVLLITTVPSVARNPDPCSTENLPTAVQELLKSKYPSLRPKAISDLEGYDRKLWIATNAHACPGIAVGSFENLGQRGYAILLVSTSGAKDEYKIVVVAQRKGSAEYHISLLDHGQDTPDSGLVISRVPPGKQTGFDDGQSIVLKIDAVNVEWLEKSSVLYYYANGKYHQLQTSD